MQIIECTCRAVSYIQRHLIYTFPFDTFRLNWALWFCCRSQNKLYTQLLECTLTIWKASVILRPYNPSLWGINIVAKHEIRCEVPAPILPHRRMTRGQTRSIHSQFFSFQTQIGPFSMNAFSLPSARHYSRFALARAAMK